MTSAVDRWRASDRVTLGRRTLATGLVARSPSRTAISSVAAARRQCPCTDSKVWVPLLVALIGGTFVIVTTTVSRATARDVAQLGAQ